MAKQRWSAWNLAYLALMAVGVIAAIYHASSDRWGNAIIAAGAALLGIAVWLTDQSVTVAAAAPVAPPARGPHERAAWLNQEVPRERWLPAGIMAGFAATIVMSILLVAAYLITGFIGDENGGTISRWFYHLSHNDLTDGVYDIPIAAFSVNLLAGLAWAMVYAGLVEPRLKGPGWWRGMLFALVPWLLSLVVFFPAVGGGFFGADLDAGPLPAAGNLLLHLIYGAILGTVYCIPEVSSVTAEDRRAAQLENNGTALGLVIGLTGGLIIGAALSAALGDSIEDGLNLTLAAGAIGTAIGGVVGPFMGLDYGARHGEG